MKPPTLSLLVWCTLSLAISLHPVCGDSNLVPPRREVYDDGRIFDISHKYHPDMPEWESNHGIGQFLWLSKSMKNGSRANNSEMKLPTHTGTHVDAPGHFFDHYFDGGFDVDSLDLHVLNGHRLHLAFYKRMFMVLLYMPFISLNSLYLLCFSCPCYYVN